MKKVWIIAIISISCLLLVYVLFLVNGVKQYEDKQSLKAIPSGAAVIVRSASLESLKEALTENISYKKELSHSFIVQSLISNLSVLDSLKNDVSDVLDEIEARPLYCSFHAEGKKDARALYLIDLPNRKMAGEVESFIKTYDQFKVKSKRYNSATIYELRLPSSKERVFVTINQGIISISQSSLLLEASIRQLMAADNWLNTTAFKHLEKTAGQGSKINVFINMANLPGILKPIADRSLLKQSDIIAGQFTWAELDLEVYSDRISFNGFSNDYQAGVFSQLLSNTNGQNAEIYENLPGNTRAYLTLTLDGGDELKERIHKYYKKNSLDSKYFDKVKAINRKYKVKVESTLFDALTGSLALAYGGHFQPGGTSPMGLLVMKMESESHDKTRILELLKKMHPNKGIKRKDYKPDDELKFPIYKGFPDDVAKHFFSSFLPQVPQKYLSFYDDMLLIADSPSIIEQYIYANLLNKTLENSKVHQDFLTQFSSRENAFVFCESQFLPVLMGTSLPGLFGELSQNQKMALSNFYGIGLQMCGMGDMIYSTINLKYLPTRASEPHTVWQSLLDSTVYNKPTLVKNHYTKEREVIVQDKSNNLYLLGNNGRVLWKKPLDSRVMSDIIQIDYYRNNKLQYIFNTKNKIYLLDRNGNHVANFPVKLPSEASNGMAVFDYDSNRNYRFFVACKNQKIYLYNNKGNKVPGWRFNKTDGKVTMPIQHFRSNKKDYIAFADDKRNYICDRKGNIRVKLKSPFVRNAFTPYYLINKNSPENALVTTSNDGQLTKISLKDGTVTKQEVDGMDESHSMVAYRHNNENKFLYTQEHLVKSVDEDGDEVFTKEFDESINLKVDLYQFSAQNIKFGVSSSNKGHIYLLNTDGEVYKGFPLQGQSRFSIGFLTAAAKRFNLIVGGDNNYIYNYRVD